MPSLNLRNPLRRDPNRPTLKQRAAAIKATAGRVMRRRAVEVAPSADPRLTAMVAELLEARRKLNDPAVPDGPEADALGGRETALSMAVYRFPARSIHDVAAKLPFLRDEAEDAGRAWDVRRGEVFENSLPGAAWAGLLRDIEHLAGGSTKEADAELIALGRQYDRLHAEWLAAEEANREPSRRCAAAVKRAEHLEGDEYKAAMRLAWTLPGVDEAHQAKEDAFEAIEPVAEAILALPASTPAGFAVKARVLIWGQWPGGQYGETAESDLHNDYGRRCARLLIESACAAAGVDWRGQPVTLSEIQTKA